MPRRLIADARDARPSRREFAAGSLFWALLMGLNAAGMLWRQGWGLRPLLDVGLLFAAGGLAAFAPALWFARLLGGTSRPEKACASHLLCLTVATVGLTAAFYALQYRRYYAQWHAPAFTAAWCSEFLFTGLVAFYQFAVLGLRLYFPVGFAALLVSAFVLAQPPLSLQARFGRTAPRPLSARISR